VARPKNSDLLAKQVAQLNRSKEWRKQGDREQLWERMVNLYRGKHYSTDSAEDRMLVNLAFATKNVIAPSVAINNPKFTVHARRPESADQAVITEVVLNYLWRTYKYQGDFRLAVDDMLISGHGWIKVGYKALKPKVIVQAPEAHADSEECYGVDDRDETVEGNVESEVRSFGDDDRPFVERVSPFDILVDPDARHPNEMKFIAQRIRRPAVDVMVDSRYDQKARQEVATRSAKTSEVNRGSEAIEGRSNQGAVMAYVDIWEFYDIRKGTVSVFADGAEQAYLIPPKPMPYPFGHPFVMLRNYEVPDVFYPMGELESIEELQHELNATRTQMMNHRKKYQRKTLYDKDAFDDEGLRALRSDKDNTMVPVDLTAAQTDITKVVAPMPQEGTPPEFYNQTELIKTDINEITGTSDYMRGAQQEIRRTATEAAMIQDAQNARAADKLARIEGVLAQIGARVVQLMQTYMTGEKIIRIAGPAAAPLWVKFDRDYIAGEFDFEVEGGSTQPRNESFRRQSALQLVDALAPFIQMGVVDPMAVARRVLQFGFDIADVESFIAQQQPMGAPPVGEEVTPEMGAPTPQLPPEPAESPIPGIPPELIAQLQGQVGIAA